MGFFSSSLLIIRIEKREKDQIRRKGSSFNDDSLFASVIVKSFFLYMFYRDLWEKSQRSMDKSAKKVGWAEEKKNASRNTETVNFHSRTLNTSGNFIIVTPRYFI